MDSNLCMWFVYLYIHIFEIYSNLIKNGVEYYLNITRTNSLILQIINLMRFLILV